jgi:glycosyltransferase involved in cell wall biosynthesis
VRELEQIAPGIVARGFVSNLRDVLRTCRLTVAPLRYGAGVKGKVVASLSHGVPCVATPMAVEGTGLVAGRDILIEADAEGFAEAIISAYNDSNLWACLSANGVSFARANYSAAHVRGLLREMLQTLDLPA